MKNVSSTLDASSMKQLHCASEECDAKYPTPLFNISYNDQIAGYSPKSIFVCIKHLPRHKDTTFPVGLHGEDYKQWRNNAA